MTNVENEGPSLLLTWNMIFQAFCEDTVRVFTFVSANKGLFNHLKKR